VDGALRTSLRASPALFTAAPGDPPTAGPRSHRRQGSGRPPASCGQAAPGVPVVVESDDGNRLPDDESVAGHPDPILEGLTEGPEPLVFTIRVDRDLLDQPIERLDFAAAATVLPQRSVAFPSLSRRCALPAARSCTRASVYGEKDAKATVRKPLPPKGMLAGWTGLEPATSDVTGERSEGLHQRFPEIREGVRATWPDTGRQRKAPSDGPK
jgi:hypothetical protein